MKKVLKCTKGSRLMMYFEILVITLWVFVSIKVEWAFAQVTVPTVQIPPSVIAELKQLEGRFESALAADCTDGRCFSQGCTYLSHDTVDRPRGSSLPGLSDKGEGPGSVNAQDFLKAARCEFSVETSVPQKVVEILKQRLRSKLSAGFLTVTVVAKSLPSLPTGSELGVDSSLKSESDSALGTADPSELEKRLDELALAEQLQQKVREKYSDKWNDFWTHLLPHFWWMIGLFVLTFCICVVIWALRRLGKTTLEEQAMLAEFTQPGARAGANPEISDREIETNSESEESALLPSDLLKTTSGEALIGGAGVRGLKTSKNLNLKKNFWENKFKLEPELFASLVQSFANAGRRDLASRLVLHFAHMGQSARAMPLLFSAKNLELSKYIESHASTDLIDDDEFYAELAKHEALSLLLEAQGTSLMARVRDEISPAAFGHLARALPSRLCAVLFAWLSYPAKTIAASSIPEPLLRNLAREFLLSDRADTRDYENVKALFSTLAAGPLNTKFAQTTTQITAQTAQTTHAAQTTLTAIPAESQGPVVWGEWLDSAESLSALLSALSAPQLDSVLAEWSQKQGRLPHWFSDVITPHRLLALEPNKRKEAILQLSPAETKAWISSFSHDTRELLLNGLPETYLRSVENIRRTREEESEDFWKNLRTKLLQGIQD